MTRAALALALLTAAACTEQKTEAGPPGTTQASPNASILPVPLASAGELTGAGVPSSAAPISASADPSTRITLPPPAPEQPRLDGPLPEDLLALKEASGYSLDATFRFADVPAPAPAEAPVGLHESPPSVSIDLGAGHFRMALASDAFPLPAGTEFRARTALYGHTVVWPGAVAYRVVAPGTARALFTERRADVAPLLRAKVTPSGVGFLLGHRTVRSDVETRLGTVTLEQATLPGVGGGELFCRFVVELVGAEPTTEACRPDRVPLAAAFRWAPSGSLTFTATSLTEHRDLAPASLAVPPPGALFKPGELPPSSSNLVLSREELAKLRPRATGASGKAAPASARERDPEEGLVVDNTTDRLLYLQLDGALVAWIPARSSVPVTALARGRYSAAFRDFLGMTILPPASVDVPARMRAGPADADGGMPGL